MLGSPRTRQLLGGGSWLLLAGLTGWAFHAVFRATIDPFHLLVQYREADRYLSAAETRFYLLFLVLGTAMAWFLYLGLSRLGRALAEGGSDASVNPRRKVPHDLILWGAVAVGVLAAFLVAHFVHGYAWFTDDEQAYLLQARLLSGFALTEPVLEPLEGFNNPFIVTVGSRDGAQHWTGIYPILQPALLAVGSWLWRPQLWQLVCLGLLVFHTGRLGTELFSSRAAGGIAAWLCALSPMAVGLGSTMHSAILSALLSVLATRLLLATLRNGRAVLALALGLVAGAVVLTRPMDGLLVVGICGLALLWRFASQSRERRREAAFALLGFVAGGLLPAAVFVGTNLALTGHPLRGGYWILGQEIGGLFGFGDELMFDREHTPAIGLTQTITAVVRLNVWTFAWPISLLPWLVALTTRLRTRAVMVLAAAQVLYLGAYFFFAFAGVHDFGSAYQMWQVPWLAVLTGYVLIRGAELVPAPAAGRRLLTAAASLTIVGLALFWPVQLERWRAVGEAVWTPIRAATAVADGRDAVVLWRRMQPKGHDRTWVKRPPEPDREAQLLWIHEGFAPNRSDAAIAAEVRRLHPGRIVLRLRWKHASHCSDRECFRGTPVVTIAPGSPAS